MTEDIPGNILLDRQVLDDPYPFYKKLQKQAPVWRVPGTDIYIVSRYDLIDEAASRTRDFSSNLRDVLYRDENGLPARMSRGDADLQVLPTADPPVHTAHRKILAPLMSPKRVSALEARIAEAACENIGRAIGVGTADFMQAVANSIPIAIISHMVGFQDVDIDTLREAAFDSTRIVSGTLSQSELLATFARSEETFHLVAGQYLQADPAGEGILSALKSAVEAGSLEAVHAIAMAHVLLSAGGESTVSLIGNTIAMVADDQELQEKLRADATLIPAVIEEVLRLQSPFRSHLRSVPHQTSLGGETIPADSLLLLFWGAGNRDPEIFADPDTFRLGRPRRHMAFGRGIHNCLGAPLARLEAKVVLEQLLARTSRFTLDAEQPPQWVDSLQTRRYERLPVRLEAR